ncbi:MAG: hypothetical protein ACLFQA_05975, partial [Bacteroidales bacterium]
MTRQSIIIILMLFTGAFFVTLSAQIINPEQRLRLEGLSEELDFKYKINKSEALEWAERNQVNSRIVLPDGRVRELQYIDFNGVAVWHETKNAGAAITTSTSALHPGGNLRLALTGRGMTGGIWDAGGADHKHLELENKILIKDAGVVD